MEEDRGVGGVEELRFSRTGHYDKFNISDEGRPKKLQKPGRV